jgi:molecular chaperone HscB
MKKALQICERLLDQDHDFIQSAAQVRALMFIDKFIKDIDARFDRLG